MADRYFGIEFGGDKVSVLEGGTSTAARDVEIRVTYDATANSKMELLKAIEQIVARITEDNWPPA
jgi:hypothetical protein